MRITLEADGSQEDAATDALLRAVGHMGVEILDQSAARLVPEVRDLAPGRILLRVYVADDVVAGLEIDLSQLPGAVLHPPLVIEDDWKERWKDFFTVTRVGERIVVRPPWESLEEPPAQGQIDIVIEPGMAFGTGTHETTRLSLAALERIVAGGDRVLDVGCGSGILSIAAARLGAAEVLGLDIDDPAMDAARENARANGVERRVRAERTPLSGVPGIWDVVVANILSSILVTLSEQLVAHVRPGGRLLLSGILDEEADDVAHVFETLGVSEVDRHHLAHWVALVMERPAETGRPADPS